MKKIYCLLLLLLCSAAVWAQKASIRGTVIDTSGAPMAKVSVRLVTGKDSIETITNDKGLFTIQTVVGAEVRLSISAVGFTPYQKTYTTQSAETDLGIIQIEPLSTVLNEVIVKAVNPVTVREDTIEYKASAYKVRDGAPVEDVIKKLPGVEVDKDGQIKAQGKAISRIRVNGKDFFGGDVQTATKNLPADIIENIQVIDDYGDQANLTGVKSGEPEKIININIQKNKNRGTFGNAGVAGGTDGRYAAGLMANLFQDERQLSFLGSINNTNTSIFNFGGGGRGGGMRGANFGGGGGGGGITTSKSAGINFRDQYGKKLSVYGSYSFSTASSLNESTSFSQDFNPLNIRSTNRESRGETRSNSHRVTMNLEYKMDSLNFFKATPYFSSSSFRSQNTSRSEIHRDNYFTLQNSQSFNHSASKSGGGAFIYNHKFRKRGRNINMTAGIDYADRNQDQDINNRYQNDDSTYMPVLHTDTIQHQGITIANRNIRSNARFSYMEPLRTDLFLELNYEWNKSSTRNMRSVNDIDVNGGSVFNPDQSNLFDYDFITNRVGLNLKGEKAKYRYMVGITSQPSVLKGQSVGKAVSTTYRNMNWIPQARFVYNFSRSHSLTATYGGNSREPDFMQLQPVADSSNLNNIVIGNPNLQAELNNRFGLQYNKFDSKSGNTMFVNLGFDQTQNKIVTSRVNNPSGTGRTTSYLNTDGFYNLNGNGSFSHPFSERKFTAEVNVDANYNNNISYTDNQRSKGSNWNLRPGARFRVDITELMDISLNGSYTLYQTTTRYTDYTNTTRAKTLNLGINGRNYFFKDLTIGYDLSKVYNYGFSKSVNANPVILNVFTEYRFLRSKNATIRLQGFDLFNQNTGIARTINETTITESRSNRLARYFLLSLNVRMRKFKGGKSPSNRENRERQDDRDNRGGDRGGNSRKMS